MKAFDTIIIGMGCAGLKCADELARLGRTNIAILVDDALDGTSRNAGSDKQTYYKLTLSGDEPDSVRSMAETLFSGGCVDGPNALSEAALSAPCFLKLCELGVEFPMNRYGEYIGYKTDHDPRRRATSAGPLTSKQMTEALEKSVRSKGVAFIEGKMAVRVIVCENRARGIIALDTKTNRFDAYFANNVVWATGGPAAVYKNVSYPVRHTGMTGAVLLTGAAGCNLTEWQYGLGSVAPKWNVSGTYMQALPRFVSTDVHGNDKRDFLLSGFLNEGDMLSSIFLKGYQWPFDARKAKDGSSRVDLIVQSEIQKGRRVFLDFTENPVRGDIDFSVLSREAYAYLEKAGAFLKTPIERLQRMNQPAIDFYMSRGVDLSKDMLEIALCAQHMNGGIMVDEWWETEIGGLFAIGEAAGTHGIYRPGGSALNAGQAGGARAARKISRTSEAAASKYDVSNEISQLESMLLDCLKDKDSLTELVESEGARMSAFCAAVREKTEIKKLETRTKELLDHFTELVSIASPSDAPKLFRFYDTLVTRLAVLTAISSYISAGGVNRGSSVYTENGRPDSFDKEDPFFSSIQEVHFKHGSFDTKTRPVKPLPDEDDFFENVWREFRQGKW